MNSNVGSKILLSSKKTEVRVSKITQKLLVLFKKLLYNYKKLLQLLKNKNLLQLLGKRNKALKPYKPDKNINFSQKSQYFPFSSLFSTIFFQKCF